MSFWSILTLAVGGFAIYAVVRWAVIELGKIINWFRDRAKLKQKDRNNIAFTLKEKTAQGDYEVVQGIYNQETHEVLDGQKIVSEKVDRDFDNLHANQPLVIYE